MLRVDGERIHYDLRPIEKIGAFHRSPSSLVANLESVKIADRPWRAEVLKGVRAPGTGFPFLIMLGTLRYRGGKDFCVVYKGNPVLILEFKEESFRRWIIPANDANKAALESIGRNPN